MASTIRDYIHGILLTSPPQEYTATTLTEELNKKLSPYVLRLDETKTILLYLLESGRILEVVSSHSWGGYGDGKLVWKPQNKIEKIIQDHIINARSAIAVAQFSTIPRPIGVNIANGQLIYDNFDPKYHTRSGICQ